MASGWIRGWAAPALSTVIAFLASGYCDHVFAKTLPVACTNSASGYHWKMIVDYDRKRVDALPADITTVAVRWYDPADGGYYDLDTGSGALTVRHPSSVGGYFLSGTCRLG
jgi:hypothetical protein